jgi:hypothetical protein
MEKKWRTLQPPHPSDKFTLKQAIAAWRKVEGRTGPHSPEPVAPDPDEQSETSSPDDS